jgi:hypothetical protein
MSALLRRMSSVLKFHQKLGLTQLSTFATVSALFGYGAMSDVSPSGAPKPPSADHSWLMG